MGRTASPRRASLDAYRELVGYLTDLAPAVPSKAIVLSPEAQGYRAEVEQAAEVTMTLSPTATALQTHMGKWPGMFARLLLTLHAIDAPDITMPVSGDCARMARDLMIDFFLPNALAIYETFFGKNNVDDRNTRNVAGHVLAHGLQSVTAFQIERSLHLDRVDIDTVMARLQAAGWAEPVAHRADGAKWAINPKVHDGRFADRAARESSEREAIRRRIEEAGDAQTARVDGQFGITNPLSSEARSDAAGKPLRHRTADH